MIPGYAELHCLTNYTFLRGASDPEELVHRAVELGYSALAVTDECSVSGVVRAHVAAKQARLKLIVGSEFRLEDGLRFVLLAATLEGYEGLCELITKARRAASKGEYRLARSDVPTSPRGLFAVWLPGEVPEEAEARWISGHFGEAWAAIELTRDSDDEARLGLLESIAARTGLKALAAGDVHMHLRSRKRLQDVMTAIRLRRPLAETGRELQPNAERYLRPIGRLANLLPARLLAATLDLASRCTFSLDEIRYEYPEELVPAGETPATWLRKLTLEGLARRYPEGAKESVVATVDHELKLIGEMGYEPFFLTVNDIVNFARGKDILCQGRGSAANSAVCYCLGITEVDPGKMAVLFERFISKERNEPPDIDVDFEHQRREEVIQYIYDKYGRERAALAAVVITYQPRSALRDVGKALGLSLDQVDLLSKSMSWWDDSEAMKKRLADAGFDLSNRVVKMVLELTQELVGFPRHLSQHPGGFVIDNRRLSRLVPVENASMKERTVIQWDKDDLESLGLLKVDVLGLGMLSCIRRALDFVKAHSGRELTIQEINASGDDPQVYEMIQRADTIGVFQIESRAQMSMLPRLKPVKFYDLVIEVAIVRPGPIMGGMVHPYLRRREGTEKATYANPEVEAVLQRTLGVSIFQEQVMQLAVVAAGFTPGEADQLRRAMASWKRRGGIEPFREKLVQGMLSRGYTQTFAEQIYRQIQGFGEYGFPESHAASFALLVYVSSWLKHYEPAAFAAALLNSQPLGFYSPSQLIQDARRHGVEVRPVDVLVSQVESTLEPAADGKPAVRLGLDRISGLKVESSKSIVMARELSEFDCVEDLSRRANLTRLDLTALARADALVNLAGRRRESLWETLAAEPAAPIVMPAGTETEPARFEPKTEGQEIVADYEALGLTLRRHPLALLRPRLKRMKLHSAEDVANARNGQFIRTSGIVTCRQRPATASGVMFVTLEDETGYVNLVVWKDLADRQRKPLLGSRLLGVSGRVQKQGIVVHIVAEDFTDLSAMLGALKTESHDFH
ncbi:error-prone DNA polymerase [Betaproteobacteria bacterium GR16-43]|nr:error-prone DNA polymerase [Betaproteobacteria bacterium GR16-43]